MMSRKRVNAVRKEHSGNFLYWSQVFKVPVSNPFFYLTAIKANACILLFYVSQTLPILEDYQDMPNSIWKWLSK